MPTITINGQQVSATKEDTVLSAATRAGITIPTLCHHQDLVPVGSCRLCMVEVNTVPGQVAACTLPVADGMSIETETVDLVDSRRMILEMLLKNYHDAAPASAKTNEFTHWLKHYGLPLSAPSTQTRRHPVDSDPSPFIRVDLNQCILCTRCVRSCAEVQGRFVWGVGFRGDESRIVAGLDTTMLDARCESCGACVAYCPTGALADRNSLNAGPPDRVVTTTCGYCGVGCQFDFNVKDDRIVGVASNVSAPVNGMSLCVKGRYGWDYIYHQDRLTTPLVRKYLLDGETRSPGADRGDWIPTDWPKAMDLVADRFARLKRESGPDSIGLLSSAKCSNEENYLMQKLARQVMQTNNVDHCARLCHASTVAGLAMCFGSGAMSNSMDDIVEHAEALLIIGSNTTEQHPVFGAMIRQAVLGRGLKVVVADPRRIDITEFAELHLRQQPGTDVALLNGIMHLIIANNWHDRRFIEQRCEGFDEFQEAVDHYTPQVSSKITGVPIEQLHEAAEILARNRPLAVIWAMGITQHTTGVLNVLSLGNLQMLLGNMGVPGGGVNPLRGQNNVQGACDMGALPNVLPGYQSVSDPAVLEAFQAAWAVTAGEGRPPEDTACACSRPGLTVTEMLDAAKTRCLRGLYILGEDPAMTEPDANHARQCLAAAEFVVLQEILSSETAAYADVMFPGACFAEKHGTFTNTERRIQLFGKAIEPPAQARPDWQIICDVAQRTLAQEGRVPVGPQASWDYRDAEQIMEEIATVTPSYAGVSHRRLRRGDRLQWPVLSDEHAGTKILHVDRFARGKGKFFATEHLAAKELPDDEYPLLLTTGRVLYHWHGGELTRRSAMLLEACPEAVLELHPDDASRLGIAAGSKVRVRSRRGEMDAKAAVTERVSAGLVFGNFHFPGSGNVNNLTIGALDPVAKIPEYKVCAVRVSPA